MAKLVDTFAYDLLNPFKSIKTCLNNYSAVNLTQFQPNITTLNPSSSSPTRRFSFEFVLHQPVNLADFNLIVPFTLSSTLITNPIYMSLAHELSPVSSLLFNWAIFLNNVCINLRHPYTNSLDNMFYVPVTTREQTLYGDFIINQSSRNISGDFTLNKMTAATNYVLTVPSQSGNLIMPMGRFLDLFNQFSVIPANTLMRIEFDTYTNTSIPTSLIPDNFNVYSGIASSMTTTLLMSQIKLQLTRRLVDLSVLHKTEIQFKNSFRQMIPLYHEKLDSLNTPLINEVWLKRKLSFPLAEFPELLAIWVNYGEYSHLNAPGFINSPLSTSNTIAYTGTNTKIDFRFNNDANFKTPEIMLDSNLFVIRSLKIDLNGTPLVDYEYKKQRVELSEYLQQEEYDQLPAMILNQPNYKRPFIIRLSTNPIFQDTKFKSAGGDLTITISFSKTYDTTPFSDTWITALRQYSLCIWQSTRRTYSTDIYRRTFVESN